jgi:predicted DNA-binding transcriptional regulator YafY
MINRRSFLGTLAALCGSGLFPHAGHVALADPPDDGDWDWWRNLHRTPLTVSDDPFASAMIRAAASRRDLWIVYEGGSSSGAARKVSPLGVFTVDGYVGTYVEAYCHKRRNMRTFRMERITSVV